MSISLHTELQLKALKSIPRKNRILHIDATGKLVHIPKIMRDFKQIMNYAMIVKNASSIDERGLLINESITSRQVNF